MEKEATFRQAKGAAQVFAFTGTLEEAAGVILENDDNLLPELFDLLKHKKDIPLFAEKMGILAHGEYRGVKIMKWIPSKKRTNILRKSHPFEFQRYQYMF